MEDDDYIEGDFFSAIYIALETLEELDPASIDEPWFKLLEETVDKTLAPHLEKAYKAKQKLH